MFLLGIALFVIFMVHSFYAFVFYFKKMVTFKHKPRTMKKLCSVLAVLVLVRSTAMAQPNTYKGKSKHRHAWHKHIKHYKKRM
jgi:hypothetical protein